MNGWIVFAAIASIAITALLTWVLYRLNAASEPRGENSSDGGGDGGGD